MANPVPLYDVFGMMNGEDEHLDMNRPGIPEWRLHDVVRYFTFRGYDKVLIERRGETDYSQASGEYSKSSLPPPTT